jgi:hypothetical protein
VDSDYLFGNASTPLRPSPSNRAADLFPALLQLVLVSLCSRIKPLDEMSLEALEHLFFNVFDVGEPAPTSDIAVFTVARDPPAQIEASFCAAINGIRNRFR